MFSSGCSPAQTIYFPFCWCVADHKCWGCTKPEQIIWKGSPPLQYRSVIMFFIGFCSQWCTKVSVWEMQLFQCCLSDTVKILCWFTEPQHWSPCRPACRCVRDHLNPPGWKKRTVLFSEAWEPFPPFKTLFQPLWPFGKVPDGPLPNCVCVVCVFMCSVVGWWKCEYVCVVTLQPLNCAPFIGWCVLSMSHPYLIAEKRKHCEAFGFHSHWQEGKGWEHQPARVLSPRHCFNVGQGVTSTNTTCQYQRVHSYVWISFLSIFI